MQLTFTGGRELAQALRRLPAAVAENILQASVMAGAEIVREAAAIKAPRPAERRRPGTMRLSDSIRIRVVEKARSFVTVTVGTRISYAHLVEYGHQVVARGPTRERVSITTVRISKRTGKQVVSTRLGLDPLGAVSQRRAAGQAGALGFVAPRPFMRPAWDENRENVLRRIGQVLGAGIEAEAKRLAAVSREAPTILAPVGLAA